MIRRYSGPRGFSWNISSRKSERAVIARWQQVAKRRGERGVFLSLLASSGLVVVAWRLAFSFPKKNFKKNLWDKGSSPPIDTVICSFPGIASTTTNFYFVNGLVRYVSILIIDAKVQHLWIGSPPVFIMHTTIYIYIICGESVRRRFLLRVDTAICWLQICRKGALAASFTAVVRSLKWPSVMTKAICVLMSLL